MQPVFIIGARKDGQANVVFEILLSAGVYKTIGFIDDDPQKIGMEIRNGVPVLGGLKDLDTLRVQWNCSNIIIALGDNRRRRELGVDLRERGYSLVSAIHPRSIVDGNVRLGEGLVISPGAVIVSGSIIGDCVNILTNASVDHDNKIGAGVSLSPGTHTSGRVAIGEDTFMGTGSIVIPDIHIGKGCYVGAGCVVTKNVPDHRKVVGVPAREIGFFPAY